MKIALLKRVARALRYRELPNLIGRVISVSDLAGLDAAIRANLDVSVGQLEETIASLKIGLAKYGHLDLSFRIAGSFDWGTPPKGLQDLKNLGFLNPDVLDDACIEILAEDLKQGDTIVKLFLEEQPVRDFMTY